jgi:tetratricopeptide (TPR) repeat protein
MPLPSCAPRSSPVARVAAPLGPRRAPPGSLIALILVVAVAAGSLGCGSNAANARIAALARALPATLEPSATFVGEPRTAKLRVWADAGVRAQPRWRELLLEQIDSASQFWTPLLGVRLEVVAVRDWDRQAAPAQALAELASLDDGEGVAWVLGYTGPDGTASIAMSELGGAALFGKHVVVRDWSPVPETRKLTSQLERLTAEERAEVLAAHRRHKQTVVLLHYLQQSAGAIAEVDEAWIGSRGYSSSLRTVSERGRELLSISLKSRLDGEELGPAAARLIDEIERVEAPGWVAADREAIVGQLRAIADRAKAGKVAADVPAEALAQYERAQALAKGGDVPGALSELEPLLIAYPSNATLHQARCEAMLIKPGVADDKTQSACARVSELAPADPLPDVSMARAWEAAGDRGKARAKLVEATAKAKAMPASPAVASVLSSILAMYRAMGALTWTEEVLAALPSAVAAALPEAQWVAGTRARYGITRGGAFVKPEDEGALVAGIRAALDAVYADKHVLADQQLTQLARRWPRAPGIAAVRCDLALRREQLSAARGHCAAALRADDNQSWAHYLAGILALRGPDTAGGISHLRKAIAVDPDLAQAWRALGKALQRTSDKAALSKLGAEYQAKFGQPLPP